MPSHLEKLDYIKLWTPSTTAHLLLFHPYSGRLFVSTVNSICQGCIFLIPQQPPQSKDKPAAVVNTSAASLYRKSLHPDTLLMASFLNTIEMPQNNPLDLKILSLHAQLINSARGRKLGRTIWEQINTIQPFVFIV